MTAQRQLTARDLTLGYGDRTVVEGLELELPAGQISCIVGANACGKSTLLRSLSRLLKPQGGQVILDGASIHSMPAKKLARILGLLPQSPTAPEGITVADLVGRGRNPHQRFIARWKKEDTLAVADALDATNTAALADRPVDELSGGQRQRVWIAMALAQQTDVLLLDEPTTFLDINHQVEVLDLLVDLNHRHGTTVGMVLHDINLAARYADHLFAMADGRIVAAGPPQDVVSAATIKAIFGLDSQIIEDPTTGLPLVLPRGRHRMRNGEETSA